MAFKDVWTFNIIPIMFNKNARHLRNNRIAFIMAYTNITIRMPETMLDYLDEIVSEGMAKDRSDAVRKIVAERMKRAEGSGTIRPLKVEVGRDPRKPRSPKKQATKKTRATERPRTRTKPIEDPRLVGRPLPEASDRSEPGKVKFGPMSKPAYPGTYPEWEKDPKRDMFAPPEEPEKTKED